MRLTPSPDSTRKNLIEDMQIGKSREATGTHRCNENPGRSVNLSASGGAGKSRDMPYTGGKMLNSLDKVR
jgi:hypothetical protein